MTTRSRAVIKSDVITLGSEDYDIHPEERMVAHHAYPTLTVRGVLQFLGWVPLVLAIVWWGTQVHGPATIVPAMTVGMGLAAFSAYDFHRTHPGAWRAFFRGLGSFLGAVLLVFLIRALIHAAFGEDHHH